MIQIVSGIDPEKGGYNPRIWSSHKGTENFMKEIIVNGKAESENSEFYSIRFAYQYFVFSKDKIVRDTHGKERIGNFSFSIAVLKNEEGDYFKKIEELANNYDNKKLDFSIQDKVDIVPKDSIKTGDDTVYLYYEDINELEDYFYCNDNYTKYKRIFFISNKYLNSEDSLLKSIGCERRTTFEELKESIQPNPPKGIGSRSENENPDDEKKGTLNTFKQIYKNKIAIFLFGILLGVGGLFGFQFIFYNKKLPQSEQTSSELINRFTKLTDQITAIQKDLVEFNEIMKNSPNIQTKGLDRSDDGGEINKQNEEISDFLQTRCKTMTLDSIKQKIESFPDWEKNKELIRFNNFLKLFDKDQIEKNDLQEFLENNNYNADYLKFVFYLSNKDDRTLNSVQKTDNAGETTLNDIMKKYGYPN